MKSKVLSIENVKKENNKLYHKIIAVYDYDLVIFIAKGSYLIGNELALLNNCPLLEIKASRKGNRIKKMIKPLLKIMPNGMKNILRKKELHSNYHINNTERNISFNQNIWDNYSNCKNILLVDDSVDTGYSIKSSLEVIQKYFYNSNVRVAAINRFKKSKKIVTTDFYLYEDTMLLGPWSNDSRENKQYLKMYKEWKDNYEK